MNTVQLAFTGKSCICTLKEFWQAKHELLEADQIMKVNGWKLVTSDPEIIETVTGRKTYLDNKLCACAPREQR